MEIRPPTLSPLADLRELQLGSGCLTDKGKRCCPDHQEPFYTPHSPRGLCTLLRTRSRAQWDASAPRATRVPRGPPSTELANTRKGKLSNTGDRLGTRTQQPGRRGHQQWWEGVGEEQKSRWRVEGQRRYAKRWSNSGPARTKAGSCLVCENSSILLQPSAALARPLPDTCEAAQKCAPA